MILMPPYVFTHKNTHFLSLSLSFAVTFTNTHNYTHTDTLLDSIRSKIAAEKYLFVLLTFLTGFYKAFNGIVHYCHNLDRWRIQNYLLTSTRERKKFHQECKKYLARKKTVLFLCMCVLVFLIMFLYPSL